MPEHPWLVARDAVTGESIAAGFPLEQLLDLLARQHPGKTLLITEEAGLVVCVRQKDGAACPLPEPTPLEALDRSTWLPMPA
jgi:hypothetical protein